MTHIHPLSIPFATFPSPDLIGHSVDEIPKDIEKLALLVNDMMAAAVEELNCVVVPNKGKYILSKNVFTS